MDIDTNWLDSVLAPLATEEEKRNKWQQVMDKRCRGCGSSTHTDSKNRHAQIKCHHCGRKGHMASVCLSRALGKPRSSPGASVNATVTPAPVPVAPAPVTPAPAEASISAAQFQGLVQTMAAQLKLIEDLTAKIDQHF